MATQRKAEVVWHGNLIEGEGTIVSVDERRAAAAPGLVGVTRRRSRTARRAPRS